MWEQRAPIKIPRFIFACERVRPETRGARDEAVQSRERRAGARRLCERWRGRIAQARNSYQSENPRKATIPRDPNDCPILAAVCTQEAAEFDINPLSICLREVSGEGSYFCRTAS